jgi:2-keto-4-pentenoate hydratase
MSFVADEVARFIVRAHAERSPYENVPAMFGLETVAQAYAAQDALIPHWTPSRGPVAGMKIATTTKVMQALMGIDHPCGGLIYAQTIHPSPARQSHGSFQHLVVECELAVRLARDLPAQPQPYDRASVRAAIGGVMAAFELIEDRHADYRQTRALSLIADNAWNGGIVIGAERTLPADLDLDGIAGTLEGAADGPRHGRTDDPLGALAWVADLAVQRGAPLRAGMVVITGSVIATLPIPAGATYRFSLEGVGDVTLTATAA